MSQHEKKQLEEKARKLTTLVEELRAELDTVAGELEAERSHPAYTRSLEFEQEVRVLREEAQGLREQLGGAWAAQEAEQRVSHDLRQSLAREREQNVQLKEALQHALAENLAVREHDNALVESTIRQLQEQVASLQGALSQAELANRMLTRRSRPDTAPTSRRTEETAKRTEADTRLRALETTLERAAKAVAARNALPPQPPAQPPPQPGQPPPLHMVPQHQGQDGVAGAHDSHVAGSPQHEGRQWHYQRPSNVPHAAVGFTDQQKAEIAQAHKMHDPSLLEPAGIPGYAFHPDYGIVPIVGDGPSKRQGQTNHGAGGLAKLEAAQAPSSTVNIHFHGQSPGQGQIPSLGASAELGAGARAHEYGHEAPHEAMGASTGSGGIGWSIERNAGQLHPAAHNAEFSLGHMVHEEAVPLGGGGGSAGASARMAEHDRRVQTPDDTRGADPRSTLVRKRQRRGGGEVATAPNKVSEQELEQARRQYAEEVARIREIRKHEALQQAGRV